MSNVDDVDNFFLLLDLCRQSKKTYTKEVG